MAEIREAVIVEAVRTPIGKRNGSLKDTHPVDLLAEVLKEAVSRSGVDPGLIEDHITGCVSQVGDQSSNIGATRCWPRDGPRRSRARRSTGRAGRVSRRWTSLCRGSCRASRTSSSPAVSR